MSFEGLQIGRTALAGNQIALDTIGRNIAHANDPDYARRHVEAETLADGGILTRVRQALSESLDKDTMREKSNLGLYSSQQEVMERVEGVINELSDQDLSSALDNFYTALENLSLTPHDVPARTHAIESGAKLADMFHVMADEFIKIRQTVDQEISDTALKMNTLLTRLAGLNNEIARIEGGSLAEPAADLRDERRKLLGEFSDIMNVTISEQSNGMVIVQTTGRVLVSGGEAREVTVDRSSGASQLRWKSDNGPVQPASGRLAGLLKSRDQFLASRMTELDTLARNLAWEFNKAHNTGRGLDGLREVTAETRVDPGFLLRPLDIAEVDAFSPGRYFKPRNGILTVEVRNDTTGSTDEVDLAIPLVGANKMSLEDLRQNLDQLEHLTASVDLVGRLVIKSDDGYSFFVKNDTSNVAAFLGLNNFFSGNTAASFNVKAAVQAEPRLFAAGKSAAPGDNTNMQAMVSSRDAIVDGNLSLFRSYQNFVSTVATDTDRLKALKSNQDRILADVQQRRQSVSGVSLDEEAADMLRYQRSYQASARFIAMQDEIMKILMSLV